MTLGNRFCSCNRLPKLAGLPRGTQFGYFRPLRRTLLTPQSLGWPEIMSERRRTKVKGMSLGQKRLRSPTQCIARGLWKTFFSRTVRSTTRCGVSSEATRTRLVP